MSPRAEGGILTAYYKRYRFPKLKVPYYNATHIVCKHLGLLKSRTRVHTHARHLEPRGINANAMMLLHLAWPHAPLCYLKQSYWINEALDSLKFP